MDGDGAARLDVQALQVGLLAELVVVLLDPDGVVCEDAVRDASQDCGRQTSPSSAWCAHAYAGFTQTSGHGTLDKDLHRLLHPVMPCISICGWDSSLQQLVS